MTKFQIGQQVRYIGDCVSRHHKLATVRTIYETPLGNVYDVNYDDGSTWCSCSIPEKNLEAVVTLTRQDEFLRSLLETIRINLDSDTPYQGLRVVQLRIEQRLPHLKPVCYENDDLSSGFSGCGIRHICGDKASIKRVNELVHKEQFEKLYRDLYAETQETSRQWRDQFEAMHQRAMKAEKKLAQIQEISK